MTQERENLTVPFRAADEYQHSDVEDDAHWLTAALRREQPSVPAGNDLGRGAVTSVATDTVNGTMLSEGRILEGGSGVGFGDTAETRTSFPCPDCGVLFRTEE